MRSEKEVKCWLNDLRVELHILVCLDIFAFTPPALNDAARCLMRA